MLFGEHTTVAPASRRARELESFLVSSRVDAVVPPWGGELAIEVLPELDFDRLAAAPVTWFASWSDGTTLMLPLLLRAGWMSLHGLNFMDAAFLPAPGVVPWWRLLCAGAGRRVTQRSSGALQRSFRDYRYEPCLDRWSLEEPTRWRRLGDEGPIDVSGRLVGGCADVLSRLVGTPFGDLPRWAHDHCPEGTIVFLENAGMQSTDAARCWHQLRLAGWFDGAAAVLIGRTTAPESHGLSQTDVLRQALGPLEQRGIPVLYDVDVGHQPPQLMLVHGAWTRVRYASGRAEVVQTLL